MANINVVKLGREMTYMYSVCVLINLSFIPKDIRRFGFITSDTCIWVGIAIVLTILSGLIWYIGQRKAR